MKKSLIKETKKLLLETQEYCQTVREKLGNINIILEDMIENDKKIIKIFDNYKI